MGRLVAEGRLGRLGCLGWFSFFPFLFHFLYFYKPWVPIYWYTCIANMYTS